MASLADILTTAKNLVNATNSVGQIIANINGVAIMPNISADAVVSVRAGRLARVSVITGGSSNGTIYDSSSAGVTNRPIFKIPTTIGIIEVNLPVVNGIVVSPGTGQVVTVSYS